MLGALVTYQVIPFLPTPHIDNCPSASAIIVPRLYSMDQRDFFEALVKWNNWFSCQIWHTFRSNRIVWFEYHAVQQFLVILLFPNEYTHSPLGVQQARSDPPNIVLSWIKFRDLANTHSFGLRACDEDNLDNIIIIVLLSWYQVCEDKGKGDNK